MPPGTDVVKAYVVMAYIVMAYIVMAYTVMAYTVMACTVMAYTVMACTVMACTVTAYEKTSAPIHYGKCERYVIIIRITNNVPITNMLRRVSPDRTLHATWHRCS